MGQTGNGTTIVFGTTSFDMRAISINVGERTREAIADSVLGTTGFMEYIFDPLLDPETVEIVHEFDQSNNDFSPVDQPAETVTITFPLKTGETVPATLAGTGAVISSAGPNLANGEKMVQTTTVKFDGRTGPTYTAGS